MNNLPYFSDYNKKMEKNTIYFKWIFLFYFIPNFLIVKCEDYVCKTNNDFSKTKCFNNIIKLPLKYRSGRFVTTKNGELIIEYSEDEVPGGGRLFYRLKPDGRGYYPGDNPIKQFEISDKYEGNDETGAKRYFSGRYEARNILINLVGDTTRKEYLFSTSSWYSYTELYDLESDKHWTWFTSSFFEMPQDNNIYKYIFSYIYSLLHIPNTNYYILVYIQFYVKNGDNASSNLFAIKKFSLKLQEDSIVKTIHTSIENSNNYDNRAISAVLLEKDEKLVVYYVKNIGNSAKLYVKSYTYDLGDDKETEVSSFTIDQGKGNFLEGFYLNDSYTAVIYYLDKGSKDKLSIKLYKYDSSKDYGFDTIIYKEITQNTLKPDIYYNSVYRINDKRVIFTCVTGENTDERNLFIYLFDFYSSYSKILVTMYDFKLSTYVLEKDMASYYYNNLILFTITIKDSSDNNNEYSLLMHFGYSNGTDSYINISPYLLDSNNTDIDNFNIFNYFKSTKVIENNIFDYQEEDKIKLVGIPQELIINDTNDNTLANGSIITSNPKIYQNQDVIKTSQNYSIYYQLYVKEPDFENFLNNARSYLIFQGESGADISYDDEMKTEYASRIHEPLPGRTIKVDFKLCFEYCETCKILGITTDDQYCITCLEPYRYDYFNYFGIYPSNCVPEGYFYDRETGKLVKCEGNNYKYYYNTTDGKRYCFKKDLLQKRL